MYGEERTTAKCFFFFNLLLLSILSGWFFWPCSIERMHFLASQIYNNYSSSGSGSRSNNKCNSEHAPSTITCENNLRFRFHNVYRWQFAVSMHRTTLFVAKCLTTHHLYWNRNVQSKRSAYTSFFKNHSAFSFCVVVVVLKGGNKKER